MWQRWISLLGSGLILLAGTGFFPAAASCDTNFLPVTASFQTESKGSPVKKPGKRSRYHSKGNWIQVKGYADSRFFYGQLQLLGRGKVAGYLYRSKADPFYVYGEFTRSGVIQAFDNQGVLYRLLIEPAP